jgi:anti-anti-sigma factor
MHVTVDPDPELDNVFVVALVGRLDTSGTRPFWRTVTSAVVTEGAHLLVDMAGVTSISSAGLGTLIRLRARLQATGGSMALYGCRTEVSTVIDMVRLAPAFGLVQTATEARLSITG